MRVPRPLCPPYPPPAQSLASVRGLPLPACPGPPRAGDRVGFIEPVAGVETTTDGAYYIYGGFNIDILIGRRWVISPGFAVGYFSKGSGKDLGAKTEFHSGAEIAYRFDDRSRLGLALHHISNAGITKHNPGTEIISVTYSIPVGRVFNSNEGRFRERHSRSPHAGPSPRAGEGGTRSIAAGR